ncbi:Crp/Fnr family transcriptional regulator [Dinghuibacter silviterrae]|uniref:CRP-like cAMP-binding protein n=1 Tax=Dinghuibacter silviterrae TaxID=1539049 RepID=A0A4R8DT55_9BACT|nr:Crp/Fnr family transcriptional regulator [Dinghuibacter silviterrae]TDX01472.1 CRP-like cAMP-binding protein [Dinghuibacter silviterrae]
MTSDFLGYLNDIAPLSTECKAYLQTEARVKTIHKGDYLLREGEICNKLGFLQYGCLKSSIMDGDKEKVVWFWTTGDISTSTKSFFEQTPSKNFIRALEDTQFLYLTHETLQYVYIKYPESNFVARLILEKYYVREVERAELLQSQTAIDKYQYLIANHPDLLNIVPDKDIASYIGISPYRLSHLRSQLRSRKPKT